MLTLISQWAPGAGAAGVGVIVMYMMLRHQKTSTTELTKIFTTELSTQRDNHKETIATITTEFRNDGAEDRSFFKTELKEQRETFSTEMAKVTADLHDFKTEVKDSLGQLKQAIEKVPRA